MSNAECAITSAECGRPRAEQGERRVRRRLLVNPRLQFRYIAVIVALQAVAMAVMAWAVFTVVWQPLLSEVQWNTDSARLLAGTVRRVTVTTLALCAGFGVVCAAAGLLISHGIAGPIARIKQAVRVAAEGDPNLPETFAHRVRLRRGDGLLDLADEFNALLARLEDRQHRQRELLTRVSTVVSEISETLQRGEPVTEDMLEQAQQLEGLMQRVATGP